MLSIAVKSFMLSVIMLKPNPDGVRSIEYH
jgi:hypothetical protein